jgi:hypothetical protein
MLTDPPRALGIMKPKKAGMILSLITDFPFEETMRCFQQFVPNHELFTGFLLPCFTRSGRCKAAARHGVKFRRVERCGYRVCMQQAARLRF